MSNPGGGPANWRIGCVQVQEKCLVKRTHCAVCNTIIKKGDDCVVVKTTRKGIIVNRFCGQDCLNVHDAKREAEKDEKDEFD